MAFFKRHKGRGSYNLFSAHSYFLPGIKGMFLLFALFLLGVFLASLCSGVFVILMGPSEAIQSYETLISYPLMFIPPLLYASATSRRNEGFEPGWALDNNNFGPRGGVMMAIIVSLATIACSYIIEPISLLLPDMPEYLEKALETIIEGPLWVSLLSTAVFAPLFEEWLCRGLILRGLLSKMNPTAAILISAVFFAVLHMNPWQAIPAFLLGSLFGYVYYKTGSLKLTMLMHCVNNSFAILLSRVPEFKEAESFMDVLSPWAYICIFIACVLILFSTIVILIGIPKKDDRMGGFEKIEEFKPF